MNNFKETIKNTRDYLDYVERHYNNVQRAYKELEKALKGKELLFSDPVLVELLDRKIEIHDLSKLSKEEFVQYRQYFYPTKAEETNKEWFLAGWDNHCEKNDHHWQNWTKKYTELNHDSIPCILENIVDWMAMGYEFGDTAVAYYDKNKETINIPEWGRPFMERILDLLRDVPNPEPMQDYYKDVLEYVKSYESDAYAVFRSLIKILNPRLFNEWVQTWIMESNEEDFDECFYNAHKALRQTDVFQTPEIDVLLWNYCQVSDKLVRTLRLVIDNKKFPKVDEF